ncbi:hypothetical protein BGZ95_009641 [Linnemannia exigua]|uniref:LUD domain-containing protein n=1 Tax=Linnemannia exigua TaxID=604196 RepID=A0AAD4H7Q5_9FUNG|nr:hypothetical protein BGZ95_009641 [Linnemannia exigua]
MSTRPANSFAHTTLEALIKTDEKIAHLKDGAYSKAVSPERFESARVALESKGFKVTVAQNRDEAFETLKTLIPAGVSLNVAHSTTLEEIGFIDYLIGDTPYNNVRTTILAEKDPTGAMAHGDATGSKVGGVAFGAKNVIVVVGSNKIVKDEEEAWKRTTEWCVPAAGAFSREVFKAPGTSMNHYEVLRAASPFAPGRIQVLLVNEALGF